MVNSPVSRSRSLRTALVGCGAGLSMIGFASCTDGRPDDTASVGKPADERTLVVQATDTTCAVSAPTAPSGALRFTVTNGGATVTAFSLLEQDGLRSLGEVQDIGPGLTRDLVVTAAPGTYVAACLPGMTGEGLRSEFSVTDSGVDLTPRGGDDEHLAERAIAGYAAYVTGQTDQLLTQTEIFVQLYENGKDAQARALYPKARVHWERIEPVAEPFGDLDAKLDLREVDLEVGERWSGWHRIEKDLWPPSSYSPLTRAQRSKLGADLISNTKELHRRTRTATFTLEQIANGSKALLDEIASAKVTGQEEYWSRTDLWDFQANLDGARAGFEQLRPLLRTGDPALEAQISRQFTALQRLLDQHKVSGEFVPYTELSTSDVRALTDAVDALAEPLSLLTAAVE